MAKYPIKMLKDEEGTPFVPLVSTEAVRTPEGGTVEEELGKKLEVSNMVAGTDISLSVDGNNITINNTSSKYSIKDMRSEEAKAILKDWRQEILDTGVIPPITYHVADSYMLYLTDVFIRGDSVSTAVLRFKGRGDNGKYNGYQVYYETIIFDTTTGEVSSYKNGYSTNEHEVIAHGDMSPNPKKALTTDNINSYTPTSDYHPATKKYVDDSINKTNENILPILPQNLVDNGFDYNTHQTIDTPVNYAVENISTDYWFELNANEYYESNNKGMDASYSLCKVTFNNERPLSIPVSYISSGENNYDYGIFGNIDQILSSSNSDDGVTGSEKVFKNCKGESSTDVKEIIYEIPSGEHFIYIKYKKDNSGNSGNDSLQFKIPSVISTEVYENRKMATTKYVDDNKYTLPIASTESLGGVKIGNNLSIDANGVLSANAAGITEEEVNGIIDNYGTKVNLQVGDKLGEKALSYEFPNDIENSINTSTETLCSTTCDDGGIIMISTYSNKLQYRYIDGGGGLSTQQLCTISNGAIGDLTNIPKFDIEEVNTNHYLYPYLFFKNSPILNRIENLEEKTTHDTARLTIKLAINGPSVSWTAGTDNFTINYTNGDGKFVSEKWYPTDITSNGENKVINIAKGTVFSITSTRDMHGLKKYGYCTNIQSLAASTTSTEVTCFIYKNGSIEFADGERT